MWLFPPAHLEAGPENRRPTEIIDAVIMVSVPARKEASATERSELAAPVAGEADQAGDWTGGRLYDRLAIGVLAALAILVAVTFRHYGITNDEYVQQIYGEKLWAFYLSGFADRSAFTFSNLHLYGGFFDMIAVALQAISPFGKYATRHLLCGLTGILGIAAAWQLARLLAGPRVGFLATAMLALTASWYGAMFNNTKDIPFAVAMTWMLYFTCRILRELPSPRTSLVMAFGVASGIGFATRIGAVLGVFYLAIALVAFAVMQGQHHGRWGDARRDIIATLRALLPAIPVALTFAAFFWPWAFLSPLNPLTAASELTKFYIPTQLAGQMISTKADLPRSYLPIYLVIKLPEIVLIGLAVAIWLAVTHRRRTADSSTLCWLAVGCACVIPIAYFLMAEPRLYNGIRHFFFIVPPLVVAAAAGIDALWRQADQSRFAPAGALFAAFLAAVGLREVAMMVELHPHEYVYYNAFVGGPAGAYRRYELDYWSTFLPEAVPLLEKYIKAETKGKEPAHPYTVAVCSPPEILPQYAPPFLVPTKSWPKADFFISTTNTDCDKALGGRVIIEIERDGAILGVVKDRRPVTTAQGGPAKAPIR